MAESRAVEERKRRKLQLGLAAAVLALTTTGGLATTYVLQQQSVRAAALDRMLGEAATLLDVAEKEPANTARWQAVLAAIRQVEATTGGDSESEAARRLVALRDQARSGAQAAERDRELLATLTEIRSSKHDLGPAGTQKAYGRAFREAGIDLDTLDPAGAAARLKARPGPVLLAAVAALDDWALARTEQKLSDPRKADPLQVAIAADSDPFRVKVRQALQIPVDALRAQTLEQLVGDAQSATLPPASSVLLAAFLKDTDSAIALLRSAVQRHPDDVWVNYDLADRLGEMEPAPREEQLRYYSVARGIRPETAHALADLLRSMGRTGEALAVFEDLARRRPDQMRNWAGYVQILFDEKRPEATATLERALAASRSRGNTPSGSDENPSVSGSLPRSSAKIEELIAEFREANSRQPDEAWGHTYLGFLLLEQKRIDEAIAEFGEAIRLQPDYTWAHDMLGIVQCENLNDYQAAESEFRAALRLDPKQARLHLNLANALAGQERTDEQLAELREAIRLEPTFAEPHSNLGRLLMFQGKFDEAAAEFREAIRLRPDYADAHSNLGGYLCDILQDYAAAEAEFRTAIRLQPDLAFAHGNLGIALQAQDRLDEAIASYREAIRLGFDYPIVSNGLAWALADHPDPAQRDPETAFELARKAAESDPTQRDFQNTLGVAAYRSGRHEVALAALGRSMDLANGGDPSDWFFLAMTHTALGHGDEARAWYDKAVAWEKTNPPSDGNFARYRHEAAELLGIPLPSDAEGPSKPDAVERD